MDRLDISVEPLIKNPFFSGVTYSKERDEMGREVNNGSRNEMKKKNDEDDPMTPTSVQRTLCLNATSEADVNLTDEEDTTHSPMASTFIKSRATSICGKQNSTNLINADCVCGSSTATKPLEINIEMEVGAMEEKKFLAQQQVLQFPCKTTPITDEYQITHEIIGIGESGKVMACISRSTGTKYALKVLRDGSRSRREVQLHYLTNEHENIISIIDIFDNTFAGVKCLLVVVEFLEGGDLLTIFENQGRTPYSEREVSRIVNQIGAAVQFLHEMNIAHRDIKLENVLCSSIDLDTCTYKLADFGFAKRPEKNNLMESPCCTPAYVCPEILSHERYDKSCDMWALGVVMYILLCGYPPFYSLKGLAFSPGMKERITIGLYAFPSEDWDRINQSTKNEIRHLLKTDPANRTTIQQLMNGEFLHPIPRQQNHLSAVHSDSSLSSMDTMVGDSAIGSSGSEAGCDGACECQNDQVSTTGQAQSRSAKLATQLFMHPVGTDDWNSTGEGAAGAKFFLACNTCKEDPGVETKRRSEIMLPPHAKSARNLNAISRQKQTTGEKKSKEAKATRLYSIQEEVGRALAMMRLGGDTCFVKNLNTSGNRLLERRRGRTSCVSAINCSNQNPTE